jgi:long-chain acyl-CoA synthetase
MSASDNLSSRNIFLAFEQSVRSHSSRIALKADGGRGRHYTYEEMHRQILNLAYGLTGEQFAGDNEIGLLSENRPEWAIAYLAILAAGKTVVPIDANLKPNEIGHIIDHAGLSVIISSGRFEKTVAALSSELRRYSFAEESSVGWGQLFCESGQVCPGSGDSMAALIYTSGTTGSPKAVILTHDNILSNIEGTSGALPLHPEDVMLSVLPLHHTFEATCGFLYPLMRGSCIVYARTLKSRELLQDIEGNGVTILIGVPLLFEKSCLFVVTEGGCSAGKGTLRGSKAKGRAGVGQSLRVGGGASASRDCAFLHSIRFDAASGVRIDRNVAGGFSKPRER